MHRLSDVLVLVLAIVALVLAIVAIVRARGDDLAAWGVACLAVIVIAARL